MADYIAITEAQSDPEAAVDSSLIKRLRDNPLAIAEGADNAPRVFGSAKIANPIASATITSDVSQLVITDIEPHTRIRCATTAGVTNTSFTAYILEVSENNGSNWRRVIESASNRSAGSNRFFEAEVACSPRAAFGLGGVIADATPPFLLGAGGDFSGGINAVRFRVTSGNMVAGSFVVYGVERGFG